MLEKYKECQKNFYDYVMSAHASGRLSHAYLIETNGVSYAEDLAMDFVKFLICNDCYDEKICNLIDKNNYFGFFRFDCSTDIKKDMVLELKRDFAYKSYDGRRMVYLIDDASKLNKFSANSLLKFLEEPEENIVAVFLVDNIGTVIDTVVSRCQVVRLVNNSIFHFDSLFNSFDKGVFNSDEKIDSYKKQFLNFYNSFEMEGYSVFCDSDIYCFADVLYEFFVYGYFYYSDVLDMIVGRKSSSDVLSDDILGYIIDKNSVSDIIFKLNVINDFILKLRYNINRNLFIDNFIVSLGGI